MGENSLADFYDKVGNLAVKWELSAGDLLCSADFLRDIRMEADETAIQQKFADPLRIDRTGQPVSCEFRILYPEIMLRGMAIECLLKALWVKQGNNIVENGKLIGVKNAGDHNLVQLSVAVALAINNEEKKMLERLSNYITHIGRYPIPTNWERTKNIKILYPFFSGSNEWPPTVWIGFYDDSVVNNIIGKIKKELRSP
jgi:hypothetical protein